MKALKDSTCDCGFNVMRCTFCVVYRCRTGKHDTAYEWFKPFPVKREVVDND